jgi:hypothetical protein
MLVDKNKPKETLATRILSRSRDYGIGNPNGNVFDRVFGTDTQERKISIARNMVGQPKNTLGSPNGLSPDGGLSFSPTIGVNTQLGDPKRAYEQVAENQTSYFWRQNRGRIMKYYRVAARAEVSESLDQISNEATYRNQEGETCSLWIDPLAEIGPGVRAQLHKIFRQEVLKKLLNFDLDGWSIFRTMLIEGRLFYEVVLDPNSNDIVGLNLLPSQNMIVVIEDGLIIGYRQMLEGTYSSAQNTGGKNFIDYSPNQILYCDLWDYGPGGINDPRSPVEPAIKPFNQLNAIEDAVVMYRIQWGSEKLVFKIDTGMMNPAKAQKHMKDQAKLLSRRVEYNSGTGEIGNNGKVIGLGEHFFISTSQATAGSSIDRLPAGENISNIDDLKFFKRNLVNAMKVPPGRITALQGDAENFSNGKIGEVTQSEVTFARMVARYQLPLVRLMTRLFIMVLNTHPEFQDDVRSEDLYSVVFNKSNAFQNYIEADVLATNMQNFDSIMKYVRTEEQPSMPVSQKFALMHALHWTDEQIVTNEEWMREEEAKLEANPAAPPGAAPDGMPPMG